MSDKRKLAEPKIDKMWDELLESPRSTEFLLKVEKETSRVLREKKEQNRINKSKSK